MQELLERWFGGLGEYAVDSIFPGVVVGLLGLTLIQIIVKLLDKVLNKAGMEKAVRTLIKSVLRIALYLVLCLTVANKLRIDVTGVVALASVLTLAISLALQNALANVIGGFTLVHTKPFATGDYVEIAEQSGVVQEVGLTYTKLLTADSKTISIPNSSVVSAQIVNYTVSGKRRMELKVTVPYSVDVDKVLQALYKAGDVPTKLEGTQPLAAVSTYGESGISYGLYVWATNADYWNTLCAVNKNVKTVFDAEGIPFAYPHLKVHMDK